MFSDVNGVWKLVNCWAGRNGKDKCCDVCGPLNNGFGRKSVASFVVGSNCCVGIADVVNERLGMTSINDDCGCWNCWIGGGN